MSAPRPHVVDVTDATFATSVMAESRTRPVVVDFWAAWCQPCRMIGPVLERLADEFNGQFLLAKVGVDANPQVSSLFRIQSIPAVKAFRDGRLADEFIGVIPEPLIRDFIRRVVPSEADGLVARAAQAEQAGRYSEARALYDQALEKETGHVDASLGLGRLATLEGDHEAARRLLEPLRPDPEAERLVAALDVAAWASDLRDGTGPLAAAERSAAEGRFGEALEVFLAAVRNGREKDRERARESMVKVFAVLGEGDPLTREYRRKLAAALF